MLIGGFDNGFIRRPSPKFPRNMEDFVTSASENSRDGPDSVKHGSYTRRVSGLRRFVV